MNVWTAFKVVCVRPYIPIVEVEEVPIGMIPEIEDVPNEVSPLVKKLIPLPHCLGRLAGQWPVIDVSQSLTIFACPNEIWRKKVPPRYVMYPRQNACVARHSEIHENIFSYCRVLAYFLYFFELCRTQNVGYRPPRCVVVHSIGRRLPVEIIEIKVLERLTLRPRAEIDRAFPHPSLHLARK
ncbi:hypothetical protein [Burkholderia glumae]|uniref:hypothetical protein n=1 Tax=Burkholderia glumae TaxID=337 RepID=UPI0021516C56|nr:hypothetical protein [Burkholderia glumae]